jgi:hypothetical protein
MLEVGLGPDDEADVGAGTSLEPALRSCGPAQAKADVRHIGSLSHVKCDAFGDSKSWRGYRCFGLARYGSRFSQRGASCEMECDQDRRGSLRSHLGLQSRQ